jgi:hypothetical protein
VANRSLSAASFRKCLERLTGDPGKRCNHVFTYRITVETADGEAYGLRLSAGINADDAKADVGRLKRRLCLREHDVVAADVLDGWGPSELRQHIKANVTREELDARRGG